MAIELADSGLRKTGISVIGDVRWGTHFCHFYETKQDLLDTLVLYFKAGLENNEFCLWVVSPSLTVEEAKHALRQAVPDLDRHLAEGNLEIHAHDEWYLHDGQYEPERVIQSWREKLHEALAKGYAGMRASGDTAWVQKDQWRAFREYENEFDALSADQRMIVLCTYPLTTSPAAQIFDVARLHQVAVARRHGRWETVETPELKQAKAEIKRLNDELEQKVEERTGELATVNEALKKQIIERQEAERQSRVLIDAIPHQIWSGPPDGTMDYCNERWRSYMGLEMEGARGDGWQTMLHPDDRDRVLKAWHESVVNGTPYEQEERHRRADGTYRWFLSRGVPLRDVEGRIVRWYGTNTDIEDRKRAEAMLKEREEHLRVLLENVPVAVYTCDREGLIEYYNPKAVEMWGRAPVLRDTMQRYCGSFALYHTDGTPMPFEDNIMAQVIRSGIPQRNQEVVIGRSDGTRVIALVNVAPLRNERGELIGAVNCILDISDRKRAEEALNAHALRYKTLMETSTDSIYVLDEKGDLQEANAAFLRRRGYTAAEVKGLNVADWDAQWSREQLQERLRELIGSSAVFETRHRDKDGSVFDVEVSATSVRIGGEQLFFVVTRDITERKRAEDRLRRSEEKFKALFGIAPVGISVLDRQHNVVDANPALEQITRLSKEELLNGTYRRRAYLNADGTPKPANELASERAVTENRPINNVETGIVTENGEIIWTQVSVAPLALPDASAVVITQDITERRSAEEDLKKEKEILAKVFDNIPVMIGFVGADGDVKLVNPEWERAIGWTLKELREQNVDIFVEAYPDLSYRQEVLDFVTASTGEWADLKIRVRDGRVIDAACAVVHLSDGTKVAIAQDITERKQAEEKLKATSDQLRALSARLQSVREEEATRIAREIHDELGQQLTGLKLDLRRAERKVEELESSPAVNSLLDTLVSATELADGIITTVQKIATELRPGVLDKLGLGAALQYEARRFQERSEIRCEVRLPEAEPSFSTEISTALFRIFQECLTNVARHAHASEVEAELKLEPGAVILSVHDNGRGVTPSAMATRTALGLLGMKERAALLGGEIVFHSGPDQGTTVTVRLPHIGMPPPSQAPV